MRHTHARILPSEIFSPESGGSVKARSAMDEMRTHGMMRLKDNVSKVDVGYLQNVKQRLMRLKP